MRQRTGWIVWLILLIWVLQLPTKPISEADPLNGMGVVHSEWLNEEPLYGSNLDQLAVRLALLTRALAQNVMEWMVAVGNWFVN